MNKGIFGEITLSQAIDRLKILSERGAVFIFSPSHGTVTPYDKEFREAAGTILNFVMASVELLSFSFDNCEKRNGDGENEK